MAGHSKWANIRHRKSRQDAKRGKLFTKLIREITVAARLGGEDANANPRLRAAIDAALTANMPKDTIERAVRRGGGDTDSDNYEEVRYEGYAQGGVAVMVDCLTDNRNRTASEVRHAFSKLGGNLGQDGSVAYLFNKSGLLRFAGVADEEALLEAAVEAGAEDVQFNDDGAAEVTTAPQDFAAVRDTLAAAGFTADSGELAMQPVSATPVDDETAESVLRLLEMLDDLDDVQNVYSNAEFSDAALQSLDG